VISVNAASSVNVSCSRRRMRGMEDGRPEPEYGEWGRGNAGQVGRCVTVWVESLILPGTWMPVVEWEPHPDEVSAP
jgi:hypothetical protein